MSVEPFQTTLREVMQDVFGGRLKSLCWSLVPSCPYKSPLCSQSSGRQKMPTIHSALHVNEWSVCAFPVPGNPVTRTAATWVLDPQLFALSGCQLPSMPCTNYWLWINLVVWLARTRPRLILLADPTCTQTHTVQETNRLLCGHFKEPTPSLLTSCPETQQILRSVACLLCSSLLIFLRCFILCWHACSDLIFMIRFCSFYLCSCWLVKHIAINLLHEKNLWICFAWRNLTQRHRRFSVQDFFHSLLNKCQEK